MTRRFGPSTFFVSDKSIFDGLMQKKIPKAKILEFLRKRGIFLSEKASREEIAIYVFRTFVDYYVCQQISSFLESEQRKEKITSSFVETKVERSEIISACQSLKEEISQTGETCEISQQGNTTKVTITYEEVDFSKTELRQRSTRTCEIEINGTDDGFSVRLPANDKASLLVEKVINNISSEKGIELDPQVISLKQFQNPESRSFFFERLIQSIEGYRLDDVIAVNINHKQLESSSEDSELDFDPLTDRDLDRVLTGYITKAVLNGTGVLESSEFSQLHTEGFFISRIVWYAIDRDLTNNKKVEFEALFSGPDYCSDFAYSCKGYFERKDDGGFNITRKAFERSEEKLMTNLIEKAAKAAYQEVLTKYDEPIIDDEI